MRFGNQVEMLMSYWGMGLGSTEHALKSKAVKDFIKNDKTKFDLILAEQFFQEAMLMFAHKYKAPIVTISKFN
jgi:glucuronosyltransferase